MTPELLVVIVVVALIILLVGIISSRSRRAKTPPPLPPAAPAPVPKQEKERRRETISDVTISQTVTDSENVQTFGVVHGDIHIGEQEALEVAEEDKPEPPASPAPASDFIGTPRGRERRRGEDRAAMESAPEPASAAVQFSAYYPKEVTPDDWQPLHAYVFKEAFATAVEADALEQLGERHDIRRARRPAQVPVAEGALITATPQVDGFEFNPPFMPLRFRKNWHRFDFEFQAVDAPLDEAANGRLTFMVEGVIVADVPLSIFVGQAVAEVETAGESVRPYQAIFCSYSHDDTQIVERVERAYKLLGLDYLRDVTTLKSGQHWSEELLHMIERADIFQLFWSGTAAESQYVEQEWRYALGLDRDEAHFIRPVYWQQPMPSVPDELGHIHFTYQPDLAS